MSEGTDPAEERRFVLPTLIVAISPIDPSNLIVSIALIEVAAAFGVSVALAGQIRSATSLLAIAAAMAMGALSVRYSYRSLMLAGTAPCTSWPPLSTTPEFRAVANRASDAPVSPASGILWKP